MLTADQFIAQGTTASQVLSIAKFLNSKVVVGPDNELHEPNPDLASKVRAIAEDVGRKTGVNLYTQRHQNNRKAFHKRRK